MDPKKKLRLIKVAVQPFFVLDDGENIEEIDHPATIIPASEWDTYSSDRFPTEVAAWQAKMDEDAKTPDKVKRERTQRKK